MSAHPRHLSRLLRAREIVAVLLDANPAYEPIFERLDAEVAEAEARQTADPINRARQRIEARRAAAAAGTTMDEMGQHDR